MLADLASLRCEGELLVGAVRFADLDAAVPGLTWNVGTVAIHVGAVHRWAADVVRRRLATNETGGSAAFWPDGAADWSNARLADWLRRGLEALIDTLDAVPVDLQCFTFLPDVEPRVFWTRRQAHETAIHRADIEAAIRGRSVTACSVAFAQDGLAELVGGFALEPGFARTEPGALLLSATDGDAWRIEFGGPVNLVTTGVTAERVEADATVRGPSSDLYRWAWNRPCEVTISGDPAVLELWRTVRVS